MTTLSSTPGSSVTATAPVPAASRAGTQGWRDPRLLAGVVIIAVCVLVGARVMAAADDTVSVWSARHDLTAGSAVMRSDLQPVRVHLGGTSADRYLVAGSVLAPGSRAAHDVAAGELVPRSAVVTGSGPALVEVPLSLSPDDLPASVHRGATVDVWVTPKVAAAADNRPHARLALDDVVVVDVPRSVDSLAPRTTQQVIVGVDPDQAADLGEALGQLVDGRVVLTRQAGS